MDLSPDLDRTRSHQRDASNPRSSAWVIANAGSGKTHVLTQRVIRLLLAGTDPAAILCLTFTKVAAAEMSRRVFKDLGSWTMLDDTELTRAVTEIEGRPPTPDEMRQARRLFARALETPGGLKIQTIHAFCERLLHEFPFEANVPGQFTVMDDSAAAAALARAREEVMNQAAAEPDSRLGRAMRLLAERTADMQIGEALDALIAKRDDLRRWIEKAAAVGDAGNLDDALADLRGRLGLGREESEESVSRDICDALVWNAEFCRLFAAAMGGASHNTDRKAFQALRSFVEAEGPILEADGRIEFFLTKDGSSGRKIRVATARFSAETRRARSNLEADFSAEAQRVLALVPRLDLARAYSATEALLIVGDAILQAYHLAKRQAGALDFTDLISKARNLLSRTEAAQWVLYKLDRRVDHILVDEAQDTSPDQWNVVKAIAEDFFSGAGAARATRTIFAVGDDKQSIFRFQGAEPKMLVEMQHFFERRIEQAREAFVARPLFLSFRSTQEVLHAVDTVFGKELAGEITASTYEAHSTNRPDAPGHVILLPRTVRRSKEEPEEWTAPYDAPKAAESELAETIADEILRIRNEPLPSGKRLSDGKILILVRRRDAFAAAMNRALRNRQIPTAGADRIPVSTHIAVLDLLALADVILLPDDDLQLAALLKSPLLGLSEDELMHLAIDRGGSTLWGALQDADGEVHQRAAERLRGWRKVADQVTPFRFFANILGPDGGRRAFRSRLGGEVDDVLDTFLSQALAYERVEAPSLQGFARFIRANESDIKRESDEAATGVRVMTVHGAKGLEADVVFLVDTGGDAVVPLQRNKLVDIGRDPIDDPAFLWRRNQAEAPQAQRDADQREDQETKREYLRLLYVAMTRARDVLYVAGVKLLRPPPNCWYTIVEKALVPGDVQRNDDGELAAPFRWPLEQRSPKAVRGETAATTDDVPDLPAWLNAPAPTPIAVRQPLRPSRALAEPDPILLPVPAAVPPAPGDSAVLRGRLVHRLLQFLPGIPAEHRAAAYDRLLAAEVDVASELAANLRAETDAVLARPELAILLGSQSRAEVEIVGSVKTDGGDFAVSGRIDRLVRDTVGWHLVDFKTDRAVPETVDRVDAAYILQMALYRKLLMDMEPGIAVDATLVFTAGPKIMPIPAELMEQAATELGIRANPVP
jgi:ATP-dependent helicase/nuclease subunit A